MNPLAILGMLGKVGGLVSGINFGAILPAIQSAGEFLLKYWQYTVIALLVLLNVFTGFELKHTQGNLNKEVAAHASDIAAFKKAQADADANAQAVKDNLMKESQASANQADASYSSLLSKYRTSLLRYSANQSGSSAAGHSQLSTAQGGDGPSIGTELPKTITITGDDADICSVNTARLQAVHDWAVALPKDMK